MEDILVVGNGKLNLENGVEYSVTQELADIFIMQGSIYPIGTTSKNLKEKAEKEAVKEKVADMKEQAKKHK